MNSLGKAISMALVFCVISACEKAESPKSNQPAPFEDLVLALDKDLPKYLEEQAALRAGTLGLKNVVESSVEVDALQIRHQQAIRNLYSMRDFHPLWVESQVEVAALSQEGESLFSALLDAEAVHALWQEDYHLDSIQELLKQTGDPTLVKLTSEGLTPQERSTLQAILAKNPSFAKEGADSVAAAIVSGDIPLPRLQDIANQRIESIRLVAQMKSRLDVILTDALIQYGLDLRWSNDAFVKNYDWPTDLKEPRNSTAIAKAELARNREAHQVAQRLLPVFNSPASVHDLLRDLPPNFEQYRALTKAFQTYSKIAEEGGWTELNASAQKLRLKSRGEDVINLKSRLAAEGYWSKDDKSDKFTKELRAALLEYQRTHQLWEEGWVTLETRRSLNVPAERRRDQIRVTLDRWRESRVGEDSNYIHVNIPDFHAEVWQDGKRSMRFRVVTGSSSKVWNKRTKQNEFKHATPQISGKIEHIVFNPYWNVPENILKSEIEPKITEDPLYLVENEFEWMTEESGREYIRQLPGPNNALGKVKFMFPNPQHVFLHDTNDKSKFGPPVRAFSHGCVRVENPMELAQSLLEGDDKWNAEDVGKWMERPDETWIKLDQPIPVHIEYYVTRVDGLGRTQFLADVYHLDTPRVSEIQSRLAERAKRVKQALADSNQATTSIAGE